MYSDIRTVVFEELVFINLHPNPTEGVISLEIGTQYDENVYLQILDVSGRTVFENTYSVQSGTSILSVDASTYSSGVYAIRVNTNSENYIIKEFIKQ